MSPAHAVLVCLLALVPLGTSAADVCNTTNCDSNAMCWGYSIPLCVNGTTNMTYNGAICFSTSNCASYSQVAGDITVTLDGAAPNIIKPYYSNLQTAVMNAYNNYCNTGNNYQYCCPGATDWPSRGTTVKSAMSTPTTEVLIPMASGSATRTTLLFRLNPSSTSDLCSAVTYPSTTTTAAATTTTTAAAANTTTGATTTTAAGATTTTGATTTAGTTTTGATTTAGTTTTGATTTAGSTTTGATTTAGSTTTGATTTAGSTTTGATTTAGSTTTGATTTAGATTTSVATSTSAVGRRRKRQISFEALLAEDTEDEALLKRNRRAISIVLPANTVSSIASTMSLTTIIAQTLSSAGNITVIVSVTTYGASSVACHLESSRLLISSTALMALLAFSLKRNT